MPKIAPFDNYYKDYERWFEENKFAYLSELKAIKHFIPEGKEGVEIGAGSGRFALPLGIKVGIEPSSKMGKLATQRGMKIYNGVAENLPLREESFDFALMVTTICFLDDIEKSFQEVYRILKWDSSFIIGFVDKDSPMGKTYLKKSKRNKFYKLAHFYSTPEIIILLNQTDFFQVEVIQTLFTDSPQSVKSIHNWKKGFGKGGFVVVKAFK